MNDFLSRLLGGIVPPVVTPEITPDVRRRRRHGQQKKWRNFAKELRRKKTARLARRRNRR